MKKFLIVASVVGTLLCLPSAAPAQASRCIGVEPICRPGTRPVCLCESDISLRCGWICASPG